MSKQIKTVLLIIKMDGSIYQLKEILQKEVMLMVIYVQMNLKKFKKH